MWTLCANLFIADDTGLGKTIEAGLIARELLLRKKAKTLVVAAPPSVLEQWKAEMEERFGLVFEILDRAYWTRMRRERGFGVNPWRTHSRFLISHRLLIDPAYADPMREWNDRRVLIFTENREGTKRYLREMLDGAIAKTDRADERIAVIDGHTSGARRKEVQRRFNADPKKDPLRILLATDAAREGLNFQAHCTDLFHFDLPWNPGRIEQRNGRIDRKLQPAQEVRCHYFVLPQRAEDHVLEVLVRKTETIKRELGSLAKVINDDIERHLKLALAESNEHSLNDIIQRKLLNAAPRDIDELLPQLQPQAEKLAIAAMDKLRCRGQEEAANLRATLEHQRDHIRAELDRHERQPAQLTLGFDAEEKRQLQANMNAWRRRPEQFDGDLEREPERIRAFYEVRAQRVEPVGLIYLWPETN